MLWYHSILDEADAPVIKTMRELAQQYPRYGYRRIRVFLERSGFAMSPDHAYRLWKKAGLQVPKKRSRRRVAASLPRPKAPAGPNEVWAYDFVFNACANGQKLKCLTAYIAPGKTMQNGTNESVNGNFRDECLSVEWFRSRAEAKVIIETWRKHYNRVRPHQSLNDLTPSEFARQKKSTKKQQPAEARF